MSLVRAFGLVIDSALDLPGGVPVGSGATDIVIVEGAANIDAAARQLGPYRAIDDRLQFSADGVARYLCIGGHRIIVAADPTGDSARVSALLIATVLPALLWMRGDWLLHACAFVPPGQTHAIAITAPSGGGKSTLLAEALRCGAWMVADDVMRLTGGETLPTASGLPGGLFLPNGSGTRSFLGIDPTRTCPSTVLESLVLLDRTDTGPPSLTRLTGAAALEAVLAARHRPRVPTLVADPAQHLAQSALLGRQLGIYRCSVGTAGPAATIDILMREFDLWPTNSGSAATIG